MLTLIHNVIILDEELQRAVNTLNSKISFTVRYLEKDFWTSILKDMSMCCPIYGKLGSGSKKNIWGRKWVQDSVSWL